MTYNSYTAYPRFPVPVYGKIFRIGNRFWAKIFLEEDGCHVTLESSPEFDSYEQTAEWLAANDLYVPLTFAEFMRRVKRLFSQSRSARGGSRFDRVLSCANS